MTDFTFATTPRLVCADGGSAGLGALARALDGFAAAGSEAFVFADVEPDPPETCVEAAVAAARAARVDGVVGLGGGSSMDTAKLAALLAASGETLGAVYGGDLAARRAMLQGATLAGMAFANAPVAAVHALAYPLGGRFHVPHGLSNALVLLSVRRRAGDLPPRALRPTTLRRPWPNPHATATRT